ncbi:MAG: hypothetical protein LBT13_11460, partial [Treponema sp.]|nr:hypothetical protein [Treponema sp.]
HLVVYEENYNDVMGILWDIRHNQQLKKLNAVVFLTLKNKGRAAGLGFTPLTQEHYTTMVTYCLNPDHHISFGSDSCGCHNVEAALKGMPNEDAIKTMTDPCESGLFSGFANVKGIGFPCSFMEGIEPGVNLLTHDFQEYWTTGLAAWRTKLLAGKRHCPHYPTVASL